MTPDNVLDYNKKYREEWNKKNQETYALVTFAYAELHEIILENVPDIKQRKDCLSKLGDSFLLIEPLWVAPF
jgi:hypothetical protein